MTIHVELAAAWSRFSAVQFVFNFVGGGAVVQFGEFRIDSVSERLWRGKRAVHLRPKTFAVLRYLAEHPHELVTKEDLLERVWPNVTTTDSVLKVCIVELRTALGDSAQTPRIIETVHRRGYRFIAESAAPLSEARALAVRDAEMVLELAARASNDDLQAWYALSERALACAERSGDAVLTARARAALASCRITLFGWNDRYLADSTQAREVLERESPALVPGLAFNDAYFHWLRSEYSACFEAAQQGARAARALGQEPLVLQCRFMQMYALLREGRWRRALAISARSIARAHAAGDLRMHAWLEAQRAYLHEQALDFDGARAICERSVRVSIRSDHAVGELLGSIVLAFACIGAGDLIPAEANVTALREREARGRFPACLTMHLRQAIGALALAEGNFGRARAAGLEIESIAARSGERTWLGLGLELMARSWLGENEPERALPFAIRACAAADPAAPLAAWRAWATRADIEERLGNGANAREHRRASAAIVQRLADELEDAPALRARLLGDARVQRIVSAADD